MAADPGLIEWVEEAMAPVGRVTSRRMMGGAVLYCDGIVFALVFDTLWFKADALTDAAWDEAGAQRFTYARNGQVAAINYRRAPDDCYDDDDADALRGWARLALEAGGRAPARKGKGAK